MSFSPQSVLPSPWETTTFFFYGSLQDEDVLRTIIRSDVQPSLKKAKIKGWKLKKWGPYPTVVPGSDEVEGMAFEVHSSEQYESLARYETYHYAPAACNIFIQGMRMPVKGLTFQWGSESHDELTDGVFELAEYQKHFKPPWAKPLATPKAAPTLYFAYGSNWAKVQMDRRCPNNELVGVGTLSDHIWIINDRGYANVVPKQGSEVWGILYKLNGDDERILDNCEGVPECYVKQMLTVTMMERISEGEGLMVSGVSTALVYVDTKRTSPSKPAEEYIARMNLGIDDAVAQGVPQGWIDEVVRPFIPALDTGKPVEHNDPFLKQ